MVEMSMNKAIHGAFRRDMNRFLAALAAFEPGDTERAQQLATAWANFDDQLTYHHEGEHEIAWPALEAVGVSRELLDEMDTEHDTMASTLADTRIAMATLARSANAADAAAAHRAFEHLQAVTVAHLDHEESEIEAVYLAKRGDPEIKAMGRRFGKVSPARGGRFMAWLTDGASRDEMAAIKDNVPPPVLAIIGGIFGRGYRKNIAPVWNH